MFHQESSVETIKLIPNIVSLLVKMHSEEQTQA